MTPTRSALVAWLVALAFTSPSLIAQEAKPARPGRAWRVALVGDLDAMALADQLDELLQNAHERKASLVLLEMDGNRWRNDVVWELAQLIQQSETPVAALLQDARDHRVGAGQLMLAALCEQSYIDPDTFVVSDQNDNLSASAGEEIDWERIDRELAGSLWIRLHERQGPALLARPLVDRQDNVWLSSATNESDPAATGAPIVIRGETPSDEAEQIVIARGDGTFQIKISPSQATRFKLITAVEHRPPVILRKLGVSPVSPRKFQLESGLSGAHRSAWTLLEQLNALLVDLERLPTSTDPTYQRDRRDIDNQLRRGLSDYRRGQEMLDQTQTTFPEIANLPRPASHRKDFAATLAALNKRYNELKSR